MFSNREDFLQEIGKNKGFSLTLNNFYFIMDKQPSVVEDIKIMYITSMTLTDIWATIISTKYDIMYINKWIIKDNCRYIIMPTTEECFLQRLHEIIDKKFFNITDILSKVPAIDWTPLNQSDYGKN